MEIFWICLAVYLVVGAVFYAAYLRKDEWRDGLNDEEVRFLHFMAAVILVLAWPLVMYVWVRESIEEA